MTAHPVLRGVKGQRGQLHLHGDALSLRATHQYVGAPVVAGDLEVGLPADLAKGGGEERLETEVAGRLAL